MPSIKLQSSDGEIFPIDVEIAKLSITIKTMLEDLGMDEEVLGLATFHKYNLTWAMLWHVWDCQHTFLN